MSTILHASLTARVFFLNTLVGRVAVSGCFNPRLQANPAGADEICVPLHYSHHLCFHSAVLLSGGAAALSLVISAQVDQAGDPTCVPPLCTLGAGEAACRSDTCGLLSFQHLCLQAVEHEHQSFFRNSLANVLIRGGSS